MSDKLPIEDKAHRAPPRELTTLLEVTSALAQAIALKAKERVGALIEEVEAAWRRANTLQLRLSAAGQGGGAEGVLVQLAAALNAAHATKARAILLTSGLGATRSDH